MENNKTITAIIPVHELDNVTTELLKKALTSIKSQKVKPTKALVVTSKKAQSDVEKLLKEFNGVAEKGKGETDLVFGFVVNDGETDFCSQINFGVNNCATDYFSILELDDEYSTIWFKNVYDYINSYPDSNAFLPIIAEVNEKNEFLHFTNEAVWAQGFGEKLGILDINALLAYPNFGTSGAVFNTERFNDAGGFKSNIKLTFMYELLLRLVNEDMGIMVIPKVGYLHTNSRINSLFMSYRDTKGGITPEEAKFYMDKAKTEFYFNPNLIKREIQFKPQQTPEKV